MREESGSWFRIGELSVSDKCSRLQYKPKRVLSSFFGLLVKALDCIFGRAYDDPNSREERPFEVVVQDTRVHSCDEEKQFCYLQNRAKIMSTMKYNNLDHDRMHIRAMNETNEPALAPAVPLAQGHRKAPGARWKSQKVYTPSSRSFRFKDSEV
eukprot:TRINITY_DN2099_c0_g1_i1.p2 TRINITY_DN2099_c0_g1~~TRINITY_DN2099_c0_g1_i1.p2  ORF type:complete len:154 (+),score=9.72 TRINITY_DN2099_c0_g1_i1:674-1135(+)